MTHLSCSPFSNTPRSGKCYFVCALISVSNRSGEAGLRQTQPNDCLSLPPVIFTPCVQPCPLGTRQSMLVGRSHQMHLLTYFDFLCCRLPVPWLLYAMFNDFQPVAVSSNGLFCAIVLLFLMLLFVIISIGVSKWKMNKALGFTMFCLYFSFLIISVMLEDRIIACPVSI